jgi:hypothetical protein
MAIIKFIFFSSYKETAVFATTIIIIIIIIIMESMQGAETASHRAIANTAA